MSERIELLTLQHDLFLALLLDPLDLDVGLIAQLRGDALRVGAGVLPDPRGLHAGFLDRGGVLAFRVREIGLGLLAGLDLGANGLLLLGHQLPHGRGHILEQHPEDDGMPMISPMSVAMDQPRPARLPLSTVSPPPRTRCASVSASGPTC